MSEQQQATMSEGQAAGWTPEPWSVWRTTDSTLEILADAEPRRPIAWIETDKGYEEHPGPEEDANARRIVATVNGCAGIPNEALEAGVVGDLLQACEALIAALGNYWAKPTIEAAWDMDQALKAGTRAVQAARGQTP